MRQDPRHERHARTQEHHRGISPRMRRRRKPRRPRQRPQFARRRTHSIQCRATGGTVHETGQNECRRVGSVIGKKEREPVQQEQETGSAPEFVPSSANEAVQEGHGTKALEHDPTGGLDGPTIAPPKGFAHEHPGAKVARQSNGREEKRVFGRALEQAEGIAVVLGTKSGFNDDGLKECIAVKQDVK